MVAETGVVDAGDVIDGTARRVVARKGGVDTFGHVETGCRRDAAEGESEVFRVGRGVVEPFGRDTQQGMGMGGVDALADDAGAGDFQDVGGIVEGFGVGVALTHPLPPLERGKDTFCRYVVVLQADFREAGLADDGGGDAAAAVEVAPADQGVGAGGNHQLVGQEAVAFQ